MTFSNRIDNFLELYALFRVIIEIFHENRILSSKPDRKQFWPYVAYTWTMFLLMTPPACLFMLVRRI